MTAVWIIGSSGLLGAALQRALQHSGSSMFQPAERFHWDSETKLSVQLEIAVKSYADFVGVGNKWQIYWAAGVGTMSSTEAELAVETRTLSTLLKLVESEPDLVAAKGCLAFSSSAGAIYAGAAGDIITENTPVAPTTAYAHEKLKQENLVNTFAVNNCGVTALLARMSTLYGPGQATGKQQGLIALMARCILRNKPVQIYVPLDTIRDYIISDDAASAIVAALRVLDGKQGVFTKIIASERPTTIAEIVSIYKRITRRSPRIVSSASKLTSIYTRRIQFHSITVPINKQISRTSLLVGVAQMMAAERAVFVRASR
ncbi:MAG: NAD-dependent epimerase/dehydratase family protein [Gammaproteobacteria bacterium]|nr:NAD-dependent epimerase/dehydratase family protein [Gammaproteobacteria bacterium]